MKRYPTLKKHWLNIAIILVILAMVFYYANEYLIKPWQAEADRIRLADALLHYWAEESAGEYPGVELPENPVQATSPLPDTNDGTETAPDEPAPTIPENPAPPSDGIDFDAVVGLLRVPAWGDAYAAVIVEGVSDTDIEKAVGHFPDSALPGQSGNCALAAHRTVSGGLFHKLDKLAAGNTVIIETKTHTYVYRLYGEMETVSNDAWEEVAPVPHQWGEEAGEAFITLQGCEMNREGTKRVIWHGMLAETLEK